MLRILLLLLPLSGLSAAPDPGVVAATVAGWETSPVYLSPDSGAVTTDEADALAARIEGWRDDVYVAVLPASAAGASVTPESAVDVLDALADAQGADAIYLVSFSGAGTYAAGYGNAPGAADVGQSMADAVDAHTRGQQDEILNEVLDDLGAPGGAGFPWGRVLIGVGVLAAAAAALLLVRTTRRRRRRPSGELWAGEAAYAPSFTTYADQTATVEQRAALAREDVTRLGETIDRDDLPTTDPAVAAHVQAALDAYADASRRVDALATDDELRELADTTAYARWQLDCARARLGGAPLPPRRLLCFLDPAHGPSVADASWAPAGGTPRAVPVCRACLDRMS